MINMEREQIDYGLVLILVLNLTLVTQKMVLTIWNNWTILAKQPCKLYPWYIYVYLT